MKRSWGDIPHSQNKLKVIEKDIGGTDRLINSLQARKTSLSARRKSLENTVASARRLRHLRKKISDLQGLADEEAAFLRETLAESENSAGVEVDPAQAQTPIKAEEVPAGPKSGLCSARKRRRLPRVGSDDSSEDEHLPSSTSTNQPDRTDMVSEEFDSNVRFSRPPSFLLRLISATLPS